MHLAALSSARLSSCCGVVANTGPMGLRPTVGRVTPLGQIDRSTARSPPAGLKSETALEYRHRDSVLPVVR